MTHKKPRDKRAPFRIAGLVSLRENKREGKRGGGRIEKKGKPQRVPVSNVLKSVVRKHGTNLRYDSVFKEGEGAGIGKGGRRKHRLSIALSLMAEFAGA